MARKKTKPETPASVDSTTTTVDHSEGGMTVNINIGGGGSGGGTPKANVYDDSGNQVSETGAPADYDMDYAMDSDSDMETDAAMDGDSMPPAEGASDDLGLEDEGDDMAPEGEGEDPEAEDGGGMPDDDGMSGDDGMPGDDGAPAGDGGGVETDDISGDMQGDDQKIAQLASEYEIEDLIKALALKADATSMMEDKGGMSYGEMPEGLKKALEAKTDGKSEEDDEANKKAKEAEDMGETVKEGEKPSEAEKPSGEDAKGAEEPKGEQVYAEDKVSCAEDEEDDEEKKKKEKEMSDMAEETTSEHPKDAEATGTLDHSERAMGVQGQNDLQTRVAELEEELARQKKLMREKEISDFTETLYGEGKLTQQIVAKADLVRFMETLNNKNSVNFSETGKASQFDFFKGVLKNLPSMVSFEEIATPASAPKAPKQLTPSADGYIYDPNTANLHAQALEYSEQKGVEYTIALKAILSDS